MDQALLRELAQFKMLFRRTTSQGVDIEKLIADNAYGKEILTVADLKVLSAGAVEPGVEAFAHQVKRELGHNLKIQFNTSPQIAKRLADGETYDILISPPGAITQAGDQGLVCRQGR